MPKTDGISQSTAIRFFSKIKTNDINACWEWTGYTDRAGGSFYFNQRHIRAHRFSWLLFYGTLTEPAAIHHTCSNNICVNPMHLYKMDKLGTENN